MLRKESAKVRIFDFDRDIIAALTKEDAVLLFQLDTGYPIEECQPKRELSLDEVLLVESEDDEMEQRCPRRGSGWRKTT